MRLFVLSLFVATFAFAESDAKRVCETVERSNSFLGQQCFSATDGKLFMGGAVSACSGINNDFLVIECLKATALKTFSSDELSRCARNNNGFLLVECFKKAGANACR
jgi:hypothetical protein